ncbi:MAG: hypothetical protein U5R31_05890 [Acidimicrobiia bacterium]|nr:hypothetical protein [Acidimicrobiia bacterium]
MGTAPDDTARRPTPRPPPSPRADDDDLRPDDPGLRHSVDAAPSPGDDPAALLDDGDRDHVGGDGLGLGDTVGGPGGSDDPEAAVGDAGHGLDPLGGGSDDVKGGPAARQRHGA